MVDKYTDDKAKYRSGVVTYTVEDRIGRGTGTDKSATSIVTASGIAALLPNTPLPRRNYIKVKNIGTTTVEILSSTVSGVVGYPLVQNAEFEENTDAILYIKSTGSDSEVRVFERAEGYNLDKS